MSKGGEREKEREEGVGAASADGGRPRSACSIVLGLGDIPYFVV